jgi:hypothetical protein
MRIFTLALLTFLVAILIGACTENVGDLMKLNPEGPTGPLYGRSWYNSHEARPGDTVIYRPQGYIMPPSVPRYGPVYLDGLRFDKDGQFTFYTFGPADAPEAYVGRWEPTQENQDILTMTLENTELRPPFRLRVLRVENDKLVVLRLP